MLFILAASPSIIRTESNIEGGVGGSSSSSTGIDMPDTVSEPLAVSGSVGAKALPDNAPTEVEASSGPPTPGMAPSSTGTE